MKINNVKLIIIVLAVAAIVVGGFYWYVAVNKKPANLVIIDSCSDINPQKLDVVKGADITFKNKDKSDHRLTIGGKAVDVPAGESVAVQAEFPYGAATYSYDCDGLLNVAEISIANDSTVAIISESVKPIFSESYDNLPSPLRNCIKNALGKEFNKAYTDPNYEISIAAVERMKNCSDEPHKQDITFKEYYGSQGKELQECLKTGLGDEFEKLLEDTKADLSDEHRTNMVACLNRH